MKIGPVEVVAGVAEEIVAVVGGRALLPCNLTQPGDSPILVLVYNGVTGKPVYSIDSRNSPLQSSVHWSGLGQRATFEISGPVQGLSVSHIHAQDHGEYRCRVDFSASPTRNLRVKLLVVVPPERVTILSGAGVILSGVIGPYPVGGSLVLSCRAKGGRPPPTVTWWHEGSLLDDLSEGNSSDTVTNTLTLPNLSRQHLYRVITCRAANSNLTRPLNTSVTIDMSFPPLEVQITGTLSPLAEGGNYTLVCQASGSRPSAALSWWMDGLLMTPAHDQVMMEGNVSRSSLHLSPNRHQHGAVLSCRATNPDLPTAVVEDIVKLNVQYTPRLELRPGHNLALDNIKEGDDVYFECVVEANPPVSTLRWFLQGVELTHNVSLGIIVANRSLVLQGVGRHSSGDYTCQATNTRGKAISNSLHLTVKFRPTCAEQQQWTYGSGRGEQVNVTCKVHAHPDATSFRWAFNTSAEVLNIPSNRTRVLRNRSTVTYTPMTHHDFGTLLCWGVNEVGEQHQPCVFLIVPAAAPEPVQNCSVWHNVSSAAGEVVVACRAGWSGGLKQKFTLEVREMRTTGGRQHVGPVVASLERYEEPHFTVTGLAPGTEYQLAVGASNPQGSAPLKFLHHHTPIDVAEKRTSATAAESSNGGMSQAMMAVVLAVVTGAVGSLIICSLVLLLVIRRRLRLAQQRHDRLQPRVVCHKGSAAGLTGSCDHGGFEQIQEEPDLIPVMSGGEESQTPRPPALTTAPPTTTTTKAAHYATGAPSSGGGGSGTGSVDPSSALIRERDKPASSGPGSKLQGIGGSGSGYRDSPATLEMKPQHVDSSPGYGGISNITPSGYGGPICSSHEVTGILGSPGSEGSFGSGSGISFSSKVTGTGAAVLSPDISPGIDLSRGAIRSSSIVPLTQYSGSINPIESQPEARRLSGVGVTPMAELLASSTMRGVPTTSSSASTSASVSRRSSSMALPSSEIFPHNLNTSRESCV